MAKRYLLIFLLLAGFVSGSRVWMAAQESKPNFHVVVDMVQLNVAVTDNKGNYVTGLKPSDFIITEDNVRQKIATFADVLASLGRKPPIRTGALETFWLQPTLNQNELVNRYPCQATIIYALAGM